MSEMHTVETLDRYPFKHMVATIGNLPTSFVDSMSYYECIAWLAQYIQTQIIPVVNGNSEAVEELQAYYVELKEYVDHYFDTLNIQEEVNNKLDEMAESGQLVEIIGAYLQLAGVLAFDTVADMALGENLVDGSTCRTLGKDDKYDGLGRFYKIRQITNDDDVDGVNIISITADPTNTLVAELIPTTVNVSEFATVADMVDCNLFVGTICKTVNYATANDHGGATYKIVDTAPATHYETLDNGLYAKLIEEKEVTPEMFGAVGDGETDDTTAIQACIDYAYAVKAKVLFTNNKEYGVVSITIGEPLSVDFNKAILKNLSSDDTTSVLTIGNESDTFETKTAYAGKFNISNIYVELDNKTRKYGVEIHCRRIRINMIYVRHGVKDCIYLGDNDGVWIDNIFASGDNTTTTSAGVVVASDDMILGNVEVAYCRYGVKVNANVGDFKIGTLHAWSDVANSCAIRYNSGNYYGTIDYLVIDSTQYGIDISTVGLGKMYIGAIKVFPSVNFTDWKVIRINTPDDTKGVTIGNIYGIADSDTTRRLNDFHGCLMSGLNYTQKPQWQIQFDTSNTTINFEQNNGMWYAKDAGQLTGNGSASITLGNIGAPKYTWKNIIIGVILLDGNYNVVGCGRITFNDSFVASLRTNITMTNGNTYRIQVITPLPAGYSYHE